MTQNLLINNIYKDSKEAEEAKYAIAPNNEIWSSLFDNPESNKAVDSVFICLCKVRDIFKEIDSTGDHLSLLTVLCEPSRSIDKINKLDTALPYNTKLALMHRTAGLKVKLSLLHLLGDKSVFKQVPQALKLKVDSIFTSLVTTAVYAKPGNHPKGFPITGKSTMSLLTRHFQNLNKQIKDLLPLFEAAFYIQKINPFSQDCIFNLFNEYAPQSFTDKVTDFHYLGRFFLEAGINYSFSQEEAHQIAGYTDEVWSGLRWWLLAGRRPKMEQLYYKTQTDFINLEYSKFRNAKVYSTNTFARFIKALNNFVPILWFVTLEHIANHTKYAKEGLIQYPQNFRHTYSENTWAPMYHSQFSTYPVFGTSCDLPLSLGLEAPILTGEVPLLPPAPLPPSPPPVPLYTSITLPPLVSKDSMLISDIKQQANIVPDATNNEGEQISSPPLSEEDAKQKKHEDLDLTYEEKS
jgi:hypothetical protein